MAGKLDPGERGVGLLERGENDPPVVVPQSHFASSLTGHSLFLPVWCAASLFPRQCTSDALQAVSSLSLTTWNVDAAAVPTPEQLQDIFKHAAVR